MNTVDVMMGEYDVFYVDQLWNIIEYETVTQMNRKELFHVVAHTL